MISQRTTKLLIPSGDSYLVHPAGVRARDQACHAVSQPLKILLVPGTDRCPVNISKKSISWYTGKCSVLLIALK